MRMVSTLLPTRLKEYFVLVGNMGRFFQTLQTQMTPFIRLHAAPGATKNLHTTVSTYAEILQNTCEQALMRKKVTLPLY